MHSPPETIWAWEENSHPLGRFWSWRHVDGATCYLRSDTCTSNRRIEPLLAVMRQAYIVSQSNFTGPNAEANRRAAWRGLRRKFIRAERAWRGATTS